MSQPGQREGTVRPSGQTFLTYGDCKEERRVWGYWAKDVWRLGVGRL